MKSRPDWWRGEKQNLSDGDLKFSLESVKKLKELMDENKSINPRMVVSMASYSPCDEKNLPEEFQPVCKREDASMIFERLSLAVREADLCEICANAACAGCF
ncbi:guanylin-like [Grus japonensis]|uniref:Guanylate cyclase activator 2B n=1 Tax=Grus japonensis TaxID=30415 RepID=A0ABC9XMJ6_GRUJA